MRGLVRWKGFHVVSADGYSPHPSYYPMLGADNLSVYPLGSHSDRSGRYCDLHLDRRECLGLGGGLCHCSHAVRASINVWLC